MKNVLNFDWSVTEEKVTDAVRRIVEYAHPLRVIAFGSRATGQQRADSDLDLAVILEVEDRKMAGALYAAALRDVAMEIDLVVVSKQEYDLHRPWLNSIFQYIDREGIVLYDRELSQSPCAEAIRLVGAGRVGAASSAA